MEVTIMNFINGECRNQITLMPDSIEDYVGEDNSVRVIDAYINNLNLVDLKFSKPQPNDTGRPMYDPKDLLKLYVYGYMNKIRSSRRLETESKRNLEVMWLLRKLSPDHKTISRFRKENTVALKNVFRDFVKLCMKLNLYGKELIAIDGSKFKAVNSKDRNFTEKKLQERIARIDAKIAEYLKDLEDSDWKENIPSGEKSAEEIAQIILELSQRKEIYQSYSDELVQTGETQKSLTDPDSRLMMANGKMEVCYNIQTAVDEKNKLIVDFDVTNNAQDKNQMGKMAVKSKEILETEELAVTADAGYDSATDIANCIENEIAAHVASTTGNDIQICIEVDETEISEIEKFTNGRCVYIAKRNIAVCPMGQILYPSSYKKSGKAVFRNGRACSKCTCKCTIEKYKNFEFSMKKSEFSKTYDVQNFHVKQITVSSNREILKQRKCIVEHPFGTIKRNMDAGYCLTKGLKNVSGEFSLAFLSYNLKRAINIMGTKKLIECMG
jgi:transposase